jgi:hypothetical protein
MLDNFGTGSCNDYTRPETDSGQEKSSDCVCYNLDTFQPDILQAKPHMVYNGTVGSVDVTLTCA